jgi:hypothetical protein
VPEGKIATHPHRIYPRTLSLYQIMRTLLLISYILVIIGCSSEDINKANMATYFYHDGEFQSVEIPISQEMNFVESTVWFMCTPEHISYSDTVHNQRIEISPTTQATFLNKRYEWELNEEELEEGRDRLHNHLKELNLIYLPVSKFVGKDSSSSVSLIYHTNWKIDSSRSIKYVEFIKTVQNSIGWCSVSVRKEYREINVIDDFEWADSLKNMKIIIKGDINDNIQ